jgi:hypothetical protein
MLAISAAVLGFVALFLPAVGSFALGLGALLLGIFNLTAFGNHSEYRGWAIFGLVTGIFSVVYSLLVFQGIITEPLPSLGKNF